jgi:hypothetical protein
LIGAAVDTIQKYYRIDKSGIALIKFIIESYDNAAVLRTVDRKGSVIELFISPGFLPEIDAVIAEYREQFMIREIERPDDVDPL